MANSVRVKDIADVSPMVERLERELRTTKALLEAYKAINDYLWLVVKA